MNEAWELEFIIRDDLGDEIIHREVEFPFAIDAELLDARIGQILMKISEDEDAKENPSS